MTFSPYWAETDLSLPIFGSARQGAYWPGSSQSTYLAGRDTCMRLMCCRIACCASARRDDRPSARPLSSPCAGRLHLRSRSRHKLPVTAQHRDGSANALQRAAGSHRNQNQHRSLPRACLVSAGVLKRSTGPRRSEPVPRSRRLLLAGRDARNLAGPFLDYHPLLGLRLDCGRPHLPAIRIDAWALAQEDALYLG